MVNLIKATIEDAEDLVHLRIKAFQWDVEKYGMGPPKYDSLEDMKNSIEKAIYYKIMFDNKIVGGISLYNKENNHFELGSIYIDPDYHNKGIGEATILLIEKFHPEITKWTLDTPYLSYRNHHFYEKMGYKKVGVYQPIENNEFTLFKYEKLKSELGESMHG